MKIVFNPWDYYDLDDGDELAAVILRDKDSEHLRAYRYACSLLLAERFASFLKNAFGGQSQFITDIGLPMSRVIDTAVAMRVSTQTGVALLRQTNRFPIKIDEVVKVINLFSNKPIVDAKIALDGDILSPVVILEF